MNYPDKAAPAGARIIPEAAVAMPIISNNGKTYTFTIRKGLRFSDGSAVTAKNFKWAFDRSATKAQQSPATPFMDDVVGYTAAVDGGKNPANVPGAIAPGNKFILRLTHPDGGMLSKLAMPFFQAISLKTKVDPHGVTVYPSAGPYYISSYVRGRHLVLKTNKYYKGNRPHNIDTFDITVNTNLDQSLLQVMLATLEFGLNAQAAVEAARFQTRHLVSSFDNHAWNRGDQTIGERRGRGSCRRRRTMLSYSPSARSIVAALRIASDRWHSGQHLSRHATVRLLR